MFAGAAVIAAVTSPVSAVSAHVLLTGFQTGPAGLVADFLDVAAIVLYLLGAARLAARGRPWSRRTTATFLAGVFAIWVAVGSGLAAYDDVNVTLHVIQHVILMMVAPPLLALGRPITLASQALGRPNQVRLLRVVHSRALAVLTFPLVAWFLYYGLMYTYFMDRAVYDYSISHQVFHDATHVAFLLVGYLYWQPIVGTDTTRWRLPHPVKIASIFVGMPFEAFLGIAISTMPNAIDPINTITNTRTAGQTFWILAMMASGLILSCVVLQWFRQIDRSAVREDRRAEAEAAVARSRAEALGIRDLPPGATIPWWRLQQLEAERASTVTQPPSG